MRVEFSIEVPQQSIEGCFVGVEEGDITVDVVVEMGCKIHGDWGIVESTCDGEAIDPDALPERLVYDGLQLALEGLS